MKAKIVVPPLGWFAKLADMLMIPLMYLLSGTLKEVPQGGHKWNYKRLSKSDIEKLDKSAMIHCKGISNSMQTRWLFIYHIPILGGWRNYIVLRSIIPSKNWHIGFITKDIQGVSQVRLSKSVRMLIGSGDVSFFGINTDTYEQITIKEIGRGQIGEDNQFSKEQLL